MNARLTCPKCGREMEEGYVIEYTRNGTKPTVWVEKAPEETFWGNMKTGDRETMEIRTHRCSQCGYLESYARK